MAVRDCPWLPWSGCENCSHGGANGTLTVTTAAFKPASLAAPSNNHPTGNSAGVVWAASSARHTLLIPDYCCTSQETASWLPRRPTQAGKNRDPLSRFYDLVCMIGPLIRHGHGYGLFPALVIQVTRLHNPEPLPARGNHDNPERSRNPAISTPSLAFLQYSSIHWILGENYLVTSWIVAPLICSKYELYLRWSEYSPLFT